MGQVDWESGRPPGALRWAGLPLDSTRQAIGPTKKDTGGDKEWATQSGLRSGCWAHLPFTAQCPTCCFPFRAVFIFSNHLICLHSHSQPLNASFEKHIRMCGRLNWFIVALISCLVCELIGFQKLSFYFYKARNGRGRNEAPRVSNDPTVGKALTTKSQRGFAQRFQLEMPRAYETWSFGDPEVGTPKETQGVHGRGCKAGPETQGSAPAEGSN